MDVLYDLPQLLFRTDDPIEVLSLPHSTVAAKVLRNPMIGERLPRVNDLGELKPPVWRDHHMDVIRHYAPSNQ